MPRRPVLAVLLAAVLLAGCGGADESNAYVDDVNAAQMDFAQTVDRLSSSITPESSASEDRRTLNRFEGAIGEVVADLREIDAPEVVEPEHQQLIAAMSGFGTDIDAAVDALRGGSRSAIRRAQRTLADATARVDRRINMAISGINTKLGAT